MDKCIFIKNINDIGNIKQFSVKRVYFGNEFCERLIPDSKEIKTILEFVQKNKLSLTLVTPFCTNYGSSLLKKILPILPSGTEVVFNDWGILSFIQKHKLKPVLGRLLVAIKRDPRIKNSDSKSRSFRKSNLESLDFQNFLIKNKIYRIELDNVTQGYDLILKKNIAVSLHYPFVYVSTSRKCAASRFYDFASPNFLEYNACHYECQYYTIKAHIPEAKNSLILKGNSVFYRNNSLQKNIAEMHPDRIIETVSLPFFLNDEDVWDHYYQMNFDSAPWGMQDPDQHVIDFIKYYSLDNSGKKILDIGCGHGKNSRYFIENGFKIYGIDISNTIVQYCQKNIPAGHFKRQDAAHRFFWKNFDVICDAGCLHSNNPIWHEKIITNYAKSLKKGGHLFLRIFKNDQKNNLTEPFFHVGNAPLAYGYSKKQIMALFDQEIFLIDKMFFDKNYGPEGAYYIYIIKK